MKRVRCNWRLCRRGARASSDLRVKNRAQSFMVQPSPEAERGRPHKLTAMNRLAQANRGRKKKRHQIPSVTCVKSCRSCMTCIPNKLNVAQRGGVSRLVALPRFSRCGPLSTSTDSLTSFGGHRHSAIRHHAKCAQSLAGGNASRSCRLACSSRSDTRGQ
jgi:hypothetical protein